MTIGILGGGQLGRMLALAGVPMNMRFKCLDPAPSAPAAVAAEQIVGEFDDYATLAEFVAGVDVVTYEFENVPVMAAEWLAQRVPVYPPPAALQIAQDRIHEKQFFADLGVPVPAFRTIDHYNELIEALGVIGLPAVLKTRRFGYDGKGQVVLRTSADAELAWARLGGRPLIVEQFVPFDRELSVVAVRNRSGSILCYPVVENTHRDGILRQSIAPADKAPQALAENYARLAMEKLGYVGVLAIEFFDVGGTLLVNEMAPRVHNSGHWTIEGAITSQFANHVRAIADLPLGSTQVLGAAGMLNCIGALPDRSQVLAIPGTHFHDYGKSPRPNRKVGHVTITASSSTELRQRLARLIEIIQ
jgi:5-(carboxyamino)imidazole ribonucleotide synthase